MILPKGFNDDKAEDVKATIQLNFYGDVHGACHFDIANGKIKASAGAAEDANLTINSPFELWLDIMVGKEEEIDTRNHPATRIDVQLHLGRKRSSSEPSTESHSYYDATNFSSFVASV